MDGDMQQKLSQIFEKIFAYRTDESYQKGLSFVPQPTDVIISTAMKTGSTWVSHICNGLRSKGDISFDDITDVMPILDYAHDFGYPDLQKPQPFEPRMFKTHIPYVHCPKGAGKYVILVRSPSDVVVSLYHYLKDWFFSENEVSLEIFYKTMFELDSADKITYGNQYQINYHILSWYPHRNDANVLWLHYEDLKQNLRECVRLIAEFLDIGKDDKDLQELVINQSSFEFMKKHATKFDSIPLRRRRNVPSGLPGDAGDQGGGRKLRSGEIGKSKIESPQEILDAIDLEWKKVYEATGYETYEAMREGINKELGRNFG